MSLLKIYYEGKRQLNPESLNLKARILLWPVIGWKYALYPWLEDQAQENLDYLKCVTDPTKRYPTVSLKKLLLTTLSSFI